MSRKVFSGIEIIFSMSKVLVVGDDARSYELLEEFFEMKGYKFLGLIANVGFHLSYAKPLLKFLL
jgi:hypothetical protein